MSKETKEDLLTEIQELKELMEWIIPDDLYFSSGGKDTNTKEYFLNIIDKIEQKIKERLK